MARSQEGGRLIVECCSAGAARYRGEIAAVPGCACGCWRAGCQLSSYALSTAGPGIPAQLSRLWRRYTYAWHAPFAFIMERRP